MLLSKRLFITVHIELVGIKEPAWIPRGSTNVEPVKFQQREDPEACPSLKDQLLLLAQLNSCEGFKKERSYRRHKKFKCSQRYLTAVSSKDVQLPSSAGLVLVSSVLEHHGDDFLGHPSEVQLVQGVQQSVEGGLGALPAVPFVEHVVEGVVGHDHDDVVLLQAQPAPKPLPVVHGDLLSQGVKRVP